jgi:prepilin-type N-terminal cleavage/methylation domain-containing protein
MTGRRNGFTLIEMLVAMALMMILLALMIQTFRTANEVGRKTRAWIEIHQNARSLFEFMERDISGAVLAGRRSGSLAGKYFQVANLDYTDAASVDHGQDAVRLLAGTMNPGGARIGEVGYWLQASDGIDDVRGNKMGRYIDYVNDDVEKGDDLKIDPLSSSTVWDEFKSLDVVATGVTGIEIEYLTDDGTWRDPPGSSFTNAHNLSGMSTCTVPRALRVTAHVTDSRGVFLYQASEAKKREYPWCGSGIKFVHTILISQE